MTSAHAAPDDRVLEEERARLPRRPAPGQGAEAILDLQRSHGDQGVARCRAGRRLQRVQHERIPGGPATGPIPARHDICSADDPKKRKEHVNEVGQSKRVANAFERRGEGAASVRTVKVGVTFRTDSGGTADGDRALKSLQEAGRAEEAHANEVENQVGEILTVNGVE